MLSSKALLEVDLTLLKKNCAVLKELSQNSFFCPMVKSEAYGHGLLAISKALISSGVKQLGVVTVSEARQIREKFSEVDVLVFGPVLNQENLDWICKNGIVLVVNNWKDLKYLAQKKSARIHLKWDSGFSRLGFSISEKDAVKKFLDQHPQIQLEGLCSQLLSGEEVGWEDSPSFHQMEKMEMLKSSFPKLPLHLFNTVALMSLYAHEQPSLGVRPGIGLYGVKPQIKCLNQKARQKWEDLVLQPVSSLKGFLVNVRQIESGARVSYDGTWVAQRDTILATVSLGYGDGVLRSLSSQGQVLFRETLVPIVGRICMDFFMVDVTDVVEELPQLGEEVVIFGKQGKSFLSIEEQSKKAGTIPYEFFVRLGHQVDRVYV